jgi:hypothetical protein
VHTPNVDKSCHTIQQHSTAQCTQKLSHHTAALNL